MAGAAHHLDMRGSHPNDPESVIEARDIEKAAIRKWINQKMNGPVASKATSSLIGITVLRSIIGALALFTVFYWRNKYEQYKLGSTHLHGPADQYQRDKTQIVDKNIQW